MHTRMLLLLPFGISIMILLGARRRPTFQHVQFGRRRPTFGHVLFGRSGLCRQLVRGHRRRRGRLLPGEASLSEQQQRPIYHRRANEKVGSPGIVGTVRRNFVRKRTTTTTDTGLHQTCDMACREMGKDYEPKYQGRALHQDLGNGRIITSGIGDMAADAFPDYDFYVGRLTVSGMVSRGNTYHEDDVAQADYCCCHVIPPTSPPTRPTVTPTPTPALRQ